MLSLPPRPPFASVTQHSCDADFAVFRVGLLLPALEAGGPASLGRCGNLATSWGACDLVDTLLGRRSCGRDKHTPSSLVEGVLSLTSHWVTRLGSSADSLGAGKTGNKNKPLLGARPGIHCGWKFFPFPQCLWPLYLATPMRAHSPSQPHKALGTPPKDFLSQRPALQLHRCVNREARLVAVDGSLWAAGLPGANATTKSPVRGPVSAAVKGSSWAGPAVCFQIFTTFSAAEIPFWSANLPPRISPPEKKMHTMGKHTCAHHAESTRTCFLRPLPPTLDF